MFAVTATPPVALNVVAPVSSARLSTLAVLIAPAAPMPVAPLAVLEPFAIVDTLPLGLLGPDKVAALAKVAAPAVAVMVPPVPTSTVVPPVTLVTATAAAMFIAPSLVWALLLDSDCPVWVLLGLLLPAAPP